MTTTPADEPITLRFESREALIHALLTARTIGNVSMADHLIREHSAPAPSEARAVITQCRDALAEELAAWDIDPPLHHVLTAHEACEAWLAAAPETPATPAPVGLTDARESAWWALVMGAAASLEDAAIGHSDPDAKRAAEGAAKHYRAAAKAMFADAQAAKGDSA